MCAVDKMVNEFKLLFQAFEYICHSKLKYENEMGKIQNWIFFFIKTGIKILERGYYHRIRKGFVHWFAFKYRHVLDRAPYGLHSFQADFRTTTTQKLDTNLIPNITNYYVFYFQIILCIVVQFDRESHFLKLLLYYFKYSKSSKHHIQSGENVIKTNSEKKNAYICNYLLNIHQNEYCFEKRISYVIYLCICMLSWIHTYILSFPNSMEKLVWYLG